MGIRESLLARAAVTLADIKGRSARRSFSPGDPRGFQEPLPAKHFD